MNAVVVATWVGDARGSRAAAAALACAGSESDVAALLVDLAPGRAPRPALVATASARRLEERLAVHLEQAKVASRGQICHLALPADGEGLGQAPAALALVREAPCVIHLPPGLLQPALDDPKIHPTGAMLRADLWRDHALTALAARDLVRRGLPVAVLKGPLSWVPSRRALFGLLARPGPGGLPSRLLDRLLAAPADPLSPAELDAGPGVRGSPL